MIRRSLPVAVALLLSCGGSRPATQTPAPVTPPTFRLPGDVAPIRYALDLTLDPTADGFRGEIAIELDVKRPTAVVWLNATELDIDQVRLVRDGRDIPARVVPGGAEIIGVAAGEPLAAGAGARLTLRYRGKIDKVRSRGIYRQNEGDDWYLFTFFEATDARRAFPCFDEPGYKVPWKLTIRAPRNLVVAANTAEVSGAPGEGGQQVVTFADTPPLPSYLIAFVVGPFDVIDGGTAGHHGTPLRFILPRGRGAEIAYAAQATPRLIGQLEDYFGMPYPFGKLDVAVVPRYWGTMEHPGIVALGQPISLIKPGEETIARKQFYVQIGVHELAHYWFGDYVTCAWWNDTWLNEALGEWMDGKMTDVFDPSWRALLARLLETQGAMVEDTLVTAQKIRLPVESANQIENAFSATITYSKGNAVLSMFEAYLGVDTFRRVIRRYMKDHAWGVTTVDDFLAAVRDETGRPEIADAMLSFLDQPGVPSVSVGLECRKGARPTLRLSQQRHLPRASRGSSDQTWKMPVCVRTPSGRACTLLGEKTGELPLEGACPAWVVGNADAHGYYRVRYEGDLGKKLAAGARQLTVRERMGLTSDVHALIAAGELPAADGLALLPSLARDPERYVFLGAFRMLSLIRFDLLPDSLFPQHERLIAKLFGARARALGWRPRAGESDDDLQLRPLVMRIAAVAGGDERLRKEARQLALSWLSDRKGIDPSMVDAVLGVAAHRGDRALFDRLVAGWKQTNDRNERARLVRTLGAFDDPEIARAALELVRSGAIDIRDGREVVLLILRGRRTREVGYRWLEDHFDKLAPNMRDDEVTALIGGVVGGLCDREKRERAAAFYGPRAKQHDGSELALVNALERVDQCIDEWGRNRPDVEALLRRQ